MWNNSLENYCSRGSPIPLSNGLVRFCDPNNCYQSSFFGHAKEGENSNTKARSYGEAHGELGRGVGSSECLA